MEESWKGDCSLSAAIAVMPGLRTFRWTILEALPMNNLFAHILTTFRYYSVLFWSRIFGSMIRW